MTRGEIVLVEIMEIMLVEIDIDRIALASRREEIVARKAKENLKTSSGGKTPRPLAKLPKAAKISTRRESAKAAKLSHDTINRAAEIRLRAERKLGEVLKATEKNKGAKGLKGGGTRGTKKEPRVAAPPTLAESGISKKESSRAQELASVPEDESGSSAFRQITELDPVPAYLD